MALFDLKKKKTFTEIFRSDERLTTHCFKALVKKEVKQS